MTDKERFEQMVKMKAAALNVDKQSAISLMITAALVLPPDVIRVLASLAKRQADNGIR